jgi:hypothetical protein
MYRRNRRKSPFAATITREEEPTYEEMAYDEPEPPPVKVKTQKYLPGERLLRELHKKEQAKSNNLDLTNIHRSISKIIDEIAG